MNPESFQQAPWGAAIATYFVIAGVVAGLPLLLPLAADPAAPHPVERLKARTFAVTAALIAAASILLVLDLGRPERFLFMLSHLSLSSPISIGAKLIAVDGYLAAVLWFSFRSLVAARARGDDSDVERPTSTFLAIAERLALVISLGIAVYPAFVAGASYHSPLASLPGTKLAFLATALLMGLGGLAIVGSASRAASGLSGERYRRARTAIVSVHSGVLVGLALIALLRDCGRASLLVSDPSFQLAALGLLSLALPWGAVAIRREGLASSIAAGALLVAAGASARWAFLMVS